MNSEDAEDVSYLFVVSVFVVCAWFDVSLDDG